MTAAQGYADAIDARPRRTFWLEAAKQSTFVVRRDEVKARPAEPAVPE